MKTKGILLVVCLLWVTLFVQAADHVKGDGVLITKKLSLDDFNEIRINGEMEFYYEQSDATPHIEITVDQNLYPHLNVEVKNRILTVDFKKVKVDAVTKFIVKANSKWLKATRIAGNAGFIVESPLEGDELEMRGTANCLIQFKEPVRVGKIDLIVKQSANIVAEVIETEYLKCDMDGSGSITLKSGDAMIGTFSITGSSDIHAFGMEIPSITCKITGSGLAEVNATDHLKASVIGKGKILFKGSPSVANTIIGGGTIEKAK